MRPLGIADSATIVLGLQDEIRRSQESRYDHRLHGVLLVAQGMTCPEAAKLLGDAPRTVENWVHEFEEMGLAGLLEGERSGRPRRLNEKHLLGINAALRRMPREVGLGGNLWDGKTHGVDRTGVPDRLGGATMPASVSPTGISPAQTAAGDRAGRSRTSEGA